MTVYVKVLIPAKIAENTQTTQYTAGEWHEIEALEDGTVFVNIFAEGKN